MEPGEIESALCQLPSIEQAVVISRDDSPAVPGGRRLVAYLVPSPNSRGVPIDPGALREHLGQMLPDYMIPSAFVTIVSLPLTSNGKTDRQRLPAPEQTGVCAACSEPTTPEETLLCQLVAVLLGVPQVGLANHFFHLGGDSLSAMRLATQIRIRLGRDLPVQEIFEYPVLGHLAARIGLVTHGPGAFELLLPIRRKAVTLPPLFCLHPGTGLCWGYTSCCTSLPPSNRSTESQARGSIGDRNIARTLDEVVDDSLGTIRRVRPHGPYHLLGWSFGGLVAHMVATQLQAAGESVERLILLDSYPPPPDCPVAAHNGCVSDQIWRDIAGCATGVAAGRRCKY